MCPIRKRAKSLLSQQSPNAAIHAQKVSKKVAQSNLLSLSNQESNQKIQFDSFVFQAKKSPFVRNNSYFWTLHNLQMQPYIKLAQEKTPEQRQRSEEDEYSEVHSLQIQSECDLSQVKTTISLEVEGSTMAKSSLKQQMLSICESMISASVEL